MLKVNFATILSKDKDCSNESLHGETAFAPQLVVVPGLEQEHPVLTVVQFGWIQVLPASPSLRSRK